MAHSLNGLNLQASHALADIAEKDRVLQVLISRCDDDHQVTISYETLRSLRTRINSDATVIQNLWNRLEETITK